MKGKHRKSVGKGKGKGKGRIGKDGMTKQERYLVANRAKVNASNNQRNKDRLQKRKLLKSARKAVRALTPNEDCPSPASSDDLIFDIELALSLPCSDGPLPPSDPLSPIDMSDDGLDDFQALGSRFDAWCDMVDKMMTSFGRHWNAREGWKPTQSFTLTRYKSQFYLHSLTGNSILASARTVLAALDPGESRWVEMLNMMEYLTAHVAFMESVRAAWKVFSD